MRLGEAESRRELADWSHPVVVDFLHDIHAARLGADHASVRLLAMVHGRMWRFLLLDDAEKTATARRETIAIARLAGLRPAEIDKIDRATLAELMDVIVARFMRSPRLASSYGQIVLDAASSLATMAQASTRAVA